MAKSEGVGSLIPWSGLAAALVGAYIYISSASPLDSSRPRLEDDPATRELDRYAAWARLWQDPIQVAAQDSKQKNKRTIAQVTESLREIREAMATGSMHRKDVWILPVLVGGQPYAEAAESRLRTRYAALSALGAAGYVPVDGEVLHYFIAGDAKAEDAFAVPYEWFEPDSHAADRPGAPPTDRRVLLLWIAEEQLGDAPMSRLKEIIDSLSRRPEDPATASGRERRSPVHILGPSSSSLLPNLLDDVDELDEGKWDGYRLFSDRATAWAELIERDRSLSTTPFVEGAPWRSQGGFLLRRVIGNDHQLARKVILELDLRGASTFDPTRHVILVGEWDTSYARAWRQTFNSVVKGRIREEDDRSKLILPNGELANVHFFTYLRGLDGRTSGEPSPSEGSSKREDKGAPGKSDAPALAEAPVGRSQLDYLRRLEDQVRWLRRRLKEENLSNEIAAIGVIGSDVYDKLLLLRALRRSFPWSNYFTSDLDARLLLPNEMEWTKNLIVASHFDLQLPPELQAGVPPFRDSYQTSTFLACLEALDSERLRTSVPEGLRFVEPRVYQISRYGAYDLSPPSGSDVLHPRTWRMTLGEALVKLILVPMAICTLVFSLLMPLLHNLFSYEWQKEDSRRKVLVQCCVGVLLCMILIAFDASSPDGEPFLAFGGISIWPTEIIRSVALCLCIWFMHASYLKLRYDANQLEGHYPGLRLGVPAPSPAAPVSHPLTRLLSNLRRCLNLRKACRQRRRMSITFWEPHAGRVGLDYLWSRYRRLGERRNVFVRCAPNVIGFFFFFCLISTLDLPTSRLGRGFLARKLDLCLDVSLTLMASALLFFVVDTTRLCKQWITQMTAGEIRWPRPLLDGVVGKDRDLDPSAGEHFKIQLIADRTNEVGKLMYYPFIVLFLLLMARNSVFDNWNWTISIGVTYGITALGAVYCGALLRYSAEQARRKAIARVRTNLLAVSHREAKENSVESKAEAQLKNILEAIESNRRGAFCPIQENPIIHAVLIPFGGMGTLELMKLLPIFM